MEERRVRWTTGLSIQGLYVGYALLAVAVAAAGLTIHFQRPHLVGSPQYLELVTSLGIAPQVATTFSFVVPVVAATVLAVAVFLGRRDDPMALLFAGSLLGLYVFWSASPRAVAAAFPALSPVAVAVEAVGLVGLIVLVYVFPDGRFRPRWTLPVAAVLVGLVIAVPDLPATARLLIVRPEQLATWKIGLVVGMIVLLIATGAPAQLIRYRRHADTVERQQQRWILFALALVLVPAAVVLAGAAGGMSRWVVWLLFGMAIFSFVLPTAAAIALFRYRLFELDRLVSRTVSWTALSGLLGVGYLVLVVALQTLLAPLASGSQLAVAISTLAMAAMFSPARSRIQRVVDRNFYRPRYDAQKVVAAFGQSVRHAGELDALTVGVLDAVQRTLRPSSAGIWLRTGRTSEAQTVR